MGDKDAYYAALFAPAAARPHLFALAAFSAEIARIRESVSSPLPGQIRLQWWRDALAGQEHRDVGGHPVAAALLQTIDWFSLPRPAFEAMLDAREFDLFDDPMPSTGDLEGYLGETAAATIRLGSIVLAGGADPGHAATAGHAGVARGLAEILRDLPWTARRGQLFLPRDILDRYGVTREDVVSGRGGPGVRATFAELRDLARRHLAEARLESLPRTIRPAFLPTALVPAYLRRTEERGYDPFRTVLDVPSWKKIIAMWRAHRA